MKLKFHSLGAAAVDDEDEPDDEEFNETDDGDEEEGNETSDEDSEEDDEVLEADEEEDEEPKTRGSNRIRTLSDRARKEATERLRVQQENEQLRQQLLTNQQTSQQLNTQQQRQQFLNSLEPDQRILAELQFAAEDNKYAMATMQFNLQDSADRSAFLAESASNPLVAKYANVVEQRLSELRQKQGIWAPRKEILKNVVGELVLNNKLKSVSKGSAKQNIKKQKVKSSSARSDTRTPDRGSSRNEAVKRLDRLSSAKF
jgi:hypothetical protein